MGVVSVEGFLVDGSDEWKVEERSEYCAFKLLIASVRLRKLKLRLRRTERSKFLEFAYSCWSEEGWSGSSHCDDSDSKEVMPACSWSRDRDI